MKKIDQLMAELGFKKDAPQGVKEAFIKHLIKASTGVNVATPSEKREIAESPEKVVVFQTPQQLSFDFIETSLAPQSGKPRPSTKKKAVS
ncbi:hypothetical protein AZI86_06755 [Bdellovibrio bacteriovorus]|uniref:Uncharacterized protein n=1 Tax=Bdellovibrio bacteriovorus TaxID=959 RepID=A0A150WQR9_BDEBC|nr:hypothetical protein [Bdellovibrio bacteriovorus]KYG66738.1 hypothetical protein AZI86_06755 [Bdellovibrio bacteriovorus]